ncbi:hypothetical protein EYF80_025330 [Liparis tanakae]|uniref:Uncharacterized protein n=1 Tax=Liparis tanakae TaxID=230148 RepID=A0A4Z2HF61_9TELE|nr:hypothetical protein EYF80_025330 [Liparis tanakae]
MRLRLRPMVPKASWDIGESRTKCSFKNQLSIADKIGALPVGQQALDLLQMAQQEIHCDGNAALGLKSPAL